MNDVNELEKEKAKKELLKMYESGKITYLQNIDELKKESNQTTLEFRQFPAGRRKKAIFKIVEIEEKELKLKPNPNRVLLLSIPSNPENISFVGYYHENKKSRLVIFPEKKVLNEDEINKIIGALVSWLYFIKKKEIPKTISLSKDIMNYVKEFYTKLSRKLKR